MRYIAGDFIRIINPTPRQISLKGLIVIVREVITDGPNPFLKVSLPGSDDVFIWYAHRFSKIIYEGEYEVIQNRIV